MRKHAAILGMDVGAPVRRTNGVSGRLLGDFKTDYARHVFDDIFLPTTCKSLTMPCLLTRTKTSPLGVSAARA